MPEAQLDRFLMHVSISYPDAAAEQEILNLARQQARDELGDASTLRSWLPRSRCFLAQEEVLGLFMAPALEEYIVQLVLASREPGSWDETWPGWSATAPAPGRPLPWTVAPGPGPGWINGIMFHPMIFTPWFTTSCVTACLLSYEAEADGVTVDQLVDRLLDLVPVP